MNDRRDLTIAYATDLTDTRLAAATQAAWNAKSDLLTAQRRAERSQRRAQRAQDRLRAAQTRYTEALAAKSAADPLTRAHSLITAAHDKLIEIGALPEPEPDPSTIDLDGDERPAADQAADFFNRPGNYHQVHIDIEIPYTCEYEEHQRITADAVIKFTPDEQPLIVETLRQIRGALGARITLTKLHNADTNAKPELPQHAPLVTFWDKDFNAVDAPNKYTVVDAGPREYGRTVNTCEPFAEDIARANNVPTEWVHRVPSPTGDTAWTITPPAQPARGRHARPDEDDRLLPWQADMIERIAESGAEHVVVIPPPQHPQHRPISIDEIHDAAYGDDDQ